MAEDTCAGTRQTEENKARMIADRKMVSVPIISIIPEAVDYQTRK